MYVKTWKEVTSIILAGQPAGASDGFNEYNCLHYLYYMFASTRGCGASICVTVCLWQVVVVPVGVFTAVVLQRR